MLLLRIVCLDDRIITLKFSKFNNYLYGLDAIIFLQPFFFPSCWRDCITYNNDKIFLSSIRSNLLICSPRRESFPTRNYLQLNSKSDKILFVILCIGISAQYPISLYHPVIFCSHTARERRYSSHSGGGGSPVEVPACVFELGNTKIPSKLEVAPPPKCGLGEWVIPLKTDYDY